METFDLFSQCHRVRGYNGDTFPFFRVVVTGTETTGCSMRLVLERKDTPGSVALTKSCTYVSDEETTYFAVQLTGTETAQLGGAYTMHFILSDANQNDISRLVGTLEVFVGPREVS